MKNIILTIIGIVAVITSAFVQHNSKSILHRILFWLALTVTVVIIGNSGYQNITDTQKITSMGEEIKKLDPSRQIILKAEATIELTALSDHETKIGSFLDGNMNAHLLFAQNDTPIMLLPNEDCIYLSMHPSVIQRNQSVDPKPILQWISYEFQVEKNFENVPEKLTVEQLLQANKLSIRFDRIPQNKRIILGKVTSTFHCASSTFTRIFDIPDQTIDNRVVVLIPDGSFTVSNRD